MVGHKSLTTKRLVVESLSDIETSIFKALLTYHFLITVNCMIFNAQTLCVMPLAMYCLCNAIRGML